MTIKRFTVTQHDNAESRRIAQAARLILKTEINHLQPFAAATVKLIKLTQDEHSKIDDLSKVIETEPSLAAKVMRIVNSAAFNLPRKITSIKHAVNMLGFSAVRRLAIEQLCYNKLIKQKSPQLFDTLLFWQHSLFVAALSRRIASALKHPEPDQIYTGGLLHDLGKIVLESYGRLSYSDLLRSIANSENSMLANEQQFFGLTHPDMGFFLSLEWHLPPVITAMIGFHHALPPTTSAYALFNQEIAIVALANYIAWMQGLSSGITLCRPALSPNVLKIIDINQLDLETLLSLVDQDMLITQQFYNIRFPDIKTLRVTLIHSALQLSELNFIPPIKLSSTHLAIPHRSLNPDEFVPWTLATIGQDFDFDRVIMLTINRKRRSLVARYTWSRPPSNIESPPFELAIDAINGHLLECLRQHQPVLIDKRHSSADVLLDRLQVQAFIAVPILGHRRLLGMIYIDNTDSKNALNETYLSQLLPIANELGVALLNAKTYEQAKQQAEIDPLSQLYNQRAMDSFLTRLFDTAIQNLNEIAIGFVDIDHFKQFNDTCGHQAGDDALKIVADILRSSTRPGDFIGRYGGEEFLFVLQHIDQASALAYAERIRLEIEQRGKIMRERFQQHALTVSIGVALYHTSCQDYKQLIEAADQAMYQAKRQGRNRVALADWPH